METPVLTVKRAGTKFLQGNEFLTTTFLWCQTLIQGLVSSFFRLQSSNQNDGREGLTLCAWPAAQPTQPASSGPVKLVEAF